MTQTHKDTPEHLRRVNAALALRDVPDYPAALEQLEKALDQAPRDVDVLLALGLTYQDMGEWWHAEEALRTALGFAPDSESIRAALAALLSRRWRYDEIITLLEPMIERGTSDPDIWYYYAESILDQRTDEAFADLLEQAEATFAPDQTPSSILERLWQARGEKLIEWDNAEKVLEKVEDGLRILPASPPLRKVRVRTLLELGRCQEALDDIQELQSAGETGLQQEEYLALLGVGKLEQAERLTGTFGVGDIDLARAAKFLDKHGMLEQAAMAAEAAITYEEVHVLSALQLAVILAEAGKFDVAQTAVNRVLSDDVDTEDEGLEWFKRDLGVDIATEAVSGYIALMKGNHNDAVRHLKEAESLVEGREVYEIFSPVVCCFKDRPVVMSSDHLVEAALPLQTIRANLATAYCLAGDLEQALAAARAAVEVDTEVVDAYKAYAVLGCVHLAAGDHENARQAWQQALALINEEPEMEEAVTLLQEWLNNL